MTLRAPFPWFGGKRRVADVVWRAFGPDVPNYIEPFFGSGAVLLGRPGGAGKIETVNDADRYLANFWRAVTADPESVARFADWPVNEADLHARHQWLVNQAEFRERMHTDPDFYDVKIAGWWVWGLCQWIGGGWCAEPRNHKRPTFDGIGKGVHSDAGHEPPRHLPALSVGSDHGVGSGGRGIHSEAAICSYSPGRKPAIGQPGQGVHLPGLGNDRGINGVASPPALAWFLALQERLRRVRVACGDWTRVLGNSVLGKGKNVGGRRPCAVFLDPPYSTDHRAAGLYAEDGAGLSEAVRAWALEHGDDPELRIALCGYEGEHAMPSSWTKHAWKAARGYSGQGNDNRERERIWFSPHCLPIEPAARQASFPGMVGP